VVISRGRLQPLGLAAFFGHEDAVALLLERGAEASSASRNPMRVTALHAATAARSLPIVRRLLAAGIDVNAAQQQDYTALHEAVMSNQPALVELLLANGADPGARAADGKTPLSMARDSGSPELVALFASFPSA
jgi:ankyrin repeat protein